MNELRIVHNNLVYQGDSFTINELYTSEFIDYSNSKATHFYNDSHYVNELFLNTFQPWMALEKFVRTKEITHIRFESPSVLLRSLCLDIGVDGQVSLKGSYSIFFLFYWRFRAVIYLLITSAYLFLCMWRIPRKNVWDNHPEKSFILSRTQAAEKKMQKFYFPKRIEDIKSKHSLYAHFSRASRTIWVINSLFRSFNQLRIIRKHVRSLVGKYSVSIAYSFYGVRMVHTMLYERLLDSYFQRHPNETLYTGNNLDRFSVVEESMAKKHGLRVVCIPHGLEYGFRFPKGFSGDLFYTNTKFASEYLNLMYKTSKFVFDENVVKKMFTIDKILPNRVKRIVFFTEPNEVHVNVSILKKILPLLENEGWQLALKLHPKDKVLNYNTFKVDFIDTIEEALVGNICFARKSTILLECIYNRSNAAAIILNPKDSTLFYTFPSLQTNEIYVAKTIDQLFKWIKLNIKNKHYEKI